MLQNLSEKSNKEPSREEERKAKSGQGHGVYVLYFAMAGILLALCICLLKMVSRIPSAPLQIPPSLPTLASPPTRSTALHPPPQPSPLSPSPLSSPPPPSPSPLDPGATSSPDVLSPHELKLQEVNARFHRTPYHGWNAHGKLVDGGVLIHTFDGWEDHGKMWRANVGSSDLSACLIFHRQKISHNSRIPLFDGHGYGVIYQPHDTRVLCAKSESGDSGGHCSDWCPKPTKDQWEKVSHFQEPGTGCGKSWKPRDIGEYLKIQNSWYELRQRDPWYNEFIIDGDYLNDNPEIIEAVFTLGQQAQAFGARKFQHDFKKAMGANETVPIFQLDILNWEQPFSLLEEEAL